jgi:hypothetical protein
MDAMVEPYHTLVEIWQAADLVGYLDLLDSLPPQAAEVDDA